MTAKAIAKFANKQFDSSINPLIEGLDKYFGLSNKGCFVFLAGYGMKFPKSYSEHINDTFCSGEKEWRDDTDSFYDTAVDVLIERYSAQHNLDFKNVRSNGELLKQVTDELMKIANAVGKGWLDGELSSFKNKKGIPNDERETFVKLVSAYLEELNQSVDPF